MVNINDKRKVNVDNVYIKIIEIRNQTKECKCENNTDVVKNC
jgi:hypothetical protein